MVDEPSPPPEDPEGEHDESELYPFMDAVAGGNTGITIRAGWADQETGDVEGVPVVNYQGSAGSPAAEKAFQTALEWYRDTVSALVRRAQQVEVEEE